jgi:hypothetical protein
MGEPKAQDEQKLDELVTCGACQGTRQVLIHVRIGDAVAEKCPWCQGTGRIPLRLHLEIRRRQGKEERPLTNSPSRSLTRFVRALTKWWENGPR